MENTLSLNSEEQFDWREQAIIKALPTNSEYGDGVGILLQNILQNYREAAVIVVNIERLALMRFLSQKCNGFQSLLASTVYRYGRNITQVDESQPYIGWFKVIWQEKIVELALPPGIGGSAILCIADNTSLVRDFVDALNTYALYPEKRCLQFSTVWKSALDLDAEIGKVTWDDIVLQQAVLSGIKAAVEGFFTNRELFSSLGFSWRRGLLLVGPPGTGKTMVCKAAAAALPDLPFLYVRDLRGSRGQEPIKAIFERARRLSPCILAFEDIDGFVDDSNRTIFLNELDGFQNNEGLLVIASSNHPGKIDEALLKRPSRFDRVFHLGLPELPERREYCRRILLHSSLTKKLETTKHWEELAEQVAERTEGFTPAYLKEVFISAALQQALNGTSHLDHMFADMVLLQVDALRQHLQRMRSPDALAEIPSSTTTMGLRR